VSWHEPKRQPSPGLDILIVAYRAKEHLAQCLSSIALWTGRGYKMTVYDNLAHNYALTWIWNRFAEASGREIVAFLNPDILVGPGWYYEAEACMAEHPECAVVTPVSNLPLHRELVPPWVPDKMGPEEIPSVALKVQEESRRHPRFVFTDNTWAVPGHCMVVRRSAWEKLGGFDPKVPFEGNDIEFNTRVLRAGMSLGVCTRAFCYHYGNRSQHDAVEARELRAGATKPDFTPVPHGAVFSDL
jgi:GT2 family glycosyltransferase